MVEIKAGPELDYEIAQAIRLKTAICCNTVFISGREWDEIRGIEHLTCEGDLARMPFCPSTDLNVAIVAAEKVRLFDEHHLRKSAGRWVVVDTFWLKIIGENNDLRLAICAAILRLRQRPESRSTE